MYIKHVHFNKNHPENHNIKIGSKKRREISDIVIKNMSTCVRDLLLNGPGKMLLAWWV